MAGKAAKNAPRTFSGQSLSSCLLPVERVLRRRHDDAGAAPEQVEAADHSAVVLGEGVLVLSVKERDQFQFQIVTSNLQK